MVAQDIIDLCLVFQTLSLLGVILPHIYSVLAHQPAGRWSSRNVSREDGSFRRLQYNRTGFGETRVARVRASDLQPFSCLCLLNARITALHAPPCPVYIILNINFLIGYIWKLFTLFCWNASVSCMLDIHSTAIFNSFWWTRSSLMARTKPSSCLCESSVVSMFFFCSGQGLVPPRLTSKPLCNQGWLAHPIFLLSAGIIGMYDHS